MRKQYTFIALFLASIICNAQSQLAVLQKAYKYDSKDRLKEFCNRWSAEIPPISDIEIAGQSDTVRNTYKIFKAFFQSSVRAELGLDTSSKSWGNYYILPNSILVFFTNVDTSSFIARSIDPRDCQFIDTLFNFRPGPGYETTKFLFLTNKYDSLIETFLGCTHSLNAYVNFNKAGPYSYKEFYERKLFLDTCFRDDHILTRRNQSMLSFPFVNEIIFDRAMKYARLEFRNASGGGTALFKQNDNNGWILIEAKNTWFPD